MPDGCERRAGAGGRAAAGGVRGVTASAGAVAGAVESAGWIGRAAVVGLHLPVPDRVAEARQSGDVARLTRAAGRGRATHAVDAIVAVAFGARRADLAQAFLAARSGVADVARRAVGVGPARGVAGRAVARVRPARQHHGGATTAAAVARADERRGVHADGTGGSGALDSGRVALAAAFTVAEARRSAAGRALIHALGLRIGAAGRHHRAGPLGARQRARHAAGGAGGRAADALGTDAAGALDAVPVAARAVGFEAARASGAHRGRRAVRVGGADRVADAGTAPIGETRRRGRRHTGAGAVAGRLAGQRGRAGRAGGVRARRPDRVPLARSALALPIGVAAVGAAIDAGLRRIGDAGGHVRAGAHRSGQRAGTARAGAGAGAADALRAEGGRALVAVRTERAVGLLAARVAEAKVAGRAVRVHRAGVEALVAVAGERHAGDRVRRDAGARRVAGRLGREDVVVAVGGRAHGAHPVLAAAAGAVTPSIGAARRRALVGAGHPRIGRTRRHQRAATERGRKRTAAARSGASLGAAHAVDTEVAGAVRRHGARLADRLRSAASVHARMAGDAVVVAGALADAAVVGALVRRAVLHARGPAGAQAVAGARRVDAVAGGARRGDADGLGRVQGAAADAVARPRRPAGRSQLAHALAVRIGVSGVRRPAGSLPIVLVAADAGAGAPDVAAEPVGAEARAALARLGTRHAVRLQAALVVDAQAVVGAVGVGPAAGAAGVRRGIAVEGRADVGGPGPAASLAVANVGVGDGRAVACARLADGARRKFTTVSLTVTGSVEPASRDVRSRAHSRRRGHADRHERADAGGALGRARHARVRASGVAAHAAGAEAALALAAAATRLAVRTPRARVAGAGTVLTAVLLGAAAAAARGY